MGDSNLDFGPNSGGAVIKSGAGTTANTVTFPQELVGPSVSYFVEHQDGMKMLLNHLILVPHQSRQTRTGLITFYLWL